MTRTILALAALILVAPAYATDFPPVQELQRQLKAYPGSPLPKQIIWQGHVYQPYYMGARAGKAGHYTVELRLVQ